MLRSGWIKVVSVGPLDHMQGEGICQDGTMLEANT